MWSSPGGHVCLREKLRVLFCLHLVCCKFCLCLYYLYKIMAHTLRHIMRLFVFVRFGIVTWHCFSVIWRYFNSASYMCLAHQSKPSAKGRDPTLRSNALPKKGKTLPKKANENMFWCSIDVQRWVEFNSLIFACNP